MAKGSKDNNAMAAAAAMRTIQDDAYLAVIEWPVVLVHRLKEVEAHLTVTRQEPPQLEVTAPALADDARAAAPIPALAPAQKPALGQSKKMLPRGLQSKAARSSGGESVISRRKSPAGSGGAVPAVPPGKPAADGPHGQAEENTAFSLFNRPDVEGRDAR
jgi:hypothetical protein